MTRHNHRTQHVTTRQGVTGRQGLRQLLDKTLPWFLMSAVSCSRLFWETSTRQPYWTSCQCRLSCNEGWTGVWLQTPSPGPLIRHQRLHMIILHLEDQRLQSGVPGLQTDDSGCPSDVPEGWMNPKIPRVLFLPLEGRPPQNLAPGILPQSTFLQLWTLKTKSRTDLSLTRKMSRDLRIKSQQLNTSCFTRLWRHLRARSRLTLPSLAGLPESLWWI